MSYSQQLSLMDHSSFDAGSWTTYPQIKPNALLIILAT